MKLPRNKIRERAIAEMRHVGAVPAGVLELRAAPGAPKLTQADADALLKAAVAREQVSLVMDLLAYEQGRRDEAGNVVKNRKGVRVRTGAMMGMGRTGRGTPFMRDHRQGDSLAKSGTVLDSRTAKLTEDGHYQVLQTVELREPAAVERALRGLIGAVSVGLNPLGPVICTACKTEIFEKCFHFPFDVVTRSDGTTEEVEWEFTEAELVETSEVPIGAVQAAGVSGIRAALSGVEPDDGITNQDPLEKDSDMDPKLLKLLGLSATATPDEVLAAVRLRLDGAAEDKATLGIVQSELAAFRTQLGTLQAEQRKRDEEAFVYDALASGRIGKADEKHWRELFSLNAARARELMAERAVGSATPVGQPPQRGTGDPEPRDRPPVIAARGERAAARQQLAALTARLQSNPLAAAFAVHMFGFRDPGSKLTSVPDLRTVLSASGLVNGSDLDAAKIGFHAAFLERIEEVSDQIDALFTTVPSTKKVEEWDWMGDLPGMEEWDGDRKLAMLEGFKLRVANKKWQNGIRVKVDDVEDDALGLIPAQVNDLGMEAKRHRWDLMVKLLLNGFDGAAFPEVGDGIGYDGAFFFSDSHRGGSDNKLTLALDSAALVQAQLQLRRMKSYDGQKKYRTKGTHLIVGPKLEYTAEKLLTQEYLANGESNTHRNKYKLIVSDLIDGDYEDDWYLADLSRSIRPFLFQVRKELVTSSITGDRGGSNDSLPRFQYDEMWFGVDGRYNVGYFEHRLIVGSRP